MLFSDPDIEVITSGRASIGQLYRHTRNGFATITAFVSTPVYEFPVVPHDPPLRVGGAADNNRDNLAQLKALGQALRANGYGFIGTDGLYQGSGELSLLVPMIKGTGEVPAFEQFRDMIVGLGAEFNQDSVLIYHPQENQGQALLYFMANRLRDDPAAYDAAGSALGLPTDSFMLQDSSRTGFSDTYSLGDPHFFRVADKLKGMAADENADASEAERQWYAAVDKLIMGWTTARHTVQGRPTRTRSRGDTGLSFHSTEEQAAAVARKREQESDLDRVRQSLHADTQSQAYIKNFFDISV